MPERTRVEAGRRRVRVAKRTVAVTAATGFAVVVALVRQAHPATATATATASSSRSGSESGSASSSRSRQRGSTLEGGSIAPSSGGTAPLGTSTS